MLSSYLNLSEVTGFNREAKYDGIIVTRRLSKSVIPVIIKPMFQSISIGTLVM